MTEKPTISLQMIIKDEFDSVVKIITEAYPYFDELNFTVSDKKTAVELQALMHKQPKVHVKYRKWNNRFDDARNDNLAMCGSKYWFWIDADDEFPFKTIPSLVEVAEAGQYDQLLLGYNYAQNEQGDCVAFHWRERLFRTSHPFVWKGWVHETPISDVPYKMHRVSGMVVVHRNSDEHNDESLMRNHEILLAATKESDDPRYQLYLGTSYYSLGQYGDALEVLDKFVKVSGNNEDIYRALCCMSECAANMKSLDTAIKFALQASTVIPEFAQAYRLIAQYEMEGNNWPEALEWCKVADSKPVNQGLGVFDPTQREQVFLIASTCEAMQGKFNAALKWLRRLPEKHPARVEFEDEYINEADAETFILMLPKLRRYFKDSATLWNALVHDLKYDTRLRGLREQVEKPKDWPDNSIVFLIGEGYEEWGPHTLEKGMGGSEEAIVYLSRELAKLGWQVTIYGAVYEPVEDGDGVIYLPWREINKQDNFNVFVAWRAPEFSEYIKAKVKIADIHDLLQKNTMKPYGDVTYFVKSQWHRKQYPHIPDSHIRVIGNGILKGQFE